jgi:hypothetical protein
MSYQRIQSYFPRSPHFYSFLIILQTRKHLREIDNSLDILTFDPVANKSTSTINDYLYEKGNQLTVLAYTLQNISNNLTNNTETSQDFFSAIAEVLESTYNSTQQIVEY